MKIEQFYDEGLAHASYAVLSARKVILIDPARNPKPYYDFAETNDAKIVGVIETHPHADFVSSHLEIHHTTGATLYASKLLGADYPHQTFDEGDRITLGNITLEALNTPGHSPDSICVLAVDQDGTEQAIFTGDTLFVGDVGRPDLRENVGNIQAKAEELARLMYRSTREKILTLPDEVVVYPAHGPGSLCGKNISSDRFSSIGRERRENPALQEMAEDEFVDFITADQPWVPKYFQYNVALNKAGAEPFEPSIRMATNLFDQSNLADTVLIVDTRKADDFRAGHLPHSINIPDSKKFETWLGSVVAPSESFYLVGYDEEALRSLMEKVAKIGYEKSVNGLLWDIEGTVKGEAFDKTDFDQNPKSYHILDIRNEAEVAKGKIFENAIHIPLHRLRENAEALPDDKPIVVHCAGGLRSAIGASILSSLMPQARVLDMSETIKQYSTE
jgi:hydroxyacylglutathione hydrolase